MTEARAHGADSESPVVPMCDRGPGREGMLLTVITHDGFLDELAVAVPESADLVAEHLDDNDELLIHLLLSDLLRMTVSTFDAGREDVTDRLLAFVNRCLREGDDDVVDAVSVSFVEDFGAYPGESDALLARWPPDLRAELGR
jgi:hypothetical protein